MRPYLISIGTEQPNSKKVLAMVLSSHIVQVIYMPVPQDVLRASSQQQVSLYLACKIIISIYLRRGKKRLPIVYFQMCFYMYLLISLVRVFFNNLPK